MFSPNIKVAFSLIFNKVSDLLLSPKTTLPALLSVAGAPMYLSSLLVPIRESGALIPQALFAHILANVERRHIAWRAGMVAQVLSSFLMILCAFSLQNIMAGLGIVICLALWSVSRALCSLTMKDIQGEHIKKGHRGRLLGAAGTISSVISMLVAISSIVAQTMNDTMQSEKLIVIACISVVSQVICLVILWPLKTNVNTDKSSSVSQSNKRFGLGRFIVMRSLLSHTALVAPLFTLAYTGNVISIIGYLIVSQAAAGVVSTYFWGRLADRSALLAMQLGAGIATLSCFILLYALIFQTAWLDSKIFIIALFFGLNVGHGGVRTGRKVYSVDIADEQNRTQFVAHSNTVVGVFILLAGIAYTGIAAIHQPLVLVIMLIALIAGIALSLNVKHEK